MTAFNLDIDNLKANPNARVLISGLRRGRAVEAFVQNPLSMVAGNDYNNPFESQAQQSLSDVANRAIAVSNSSLGTDFANVSLKSFNQTINSWVGSQKPVFNVQLTFVAIDPEDNVMDDVNTIMRGVFPTRGSLGSIGTIMNAPLGYSPTFNTDAVSGIQVRGTVTLSIGRWFRALGLVIRTASPLYSQEVIQSGRPLYATIDCQFEPYRAISLGDFQGYFRL